MALSFCGNRVAGAGADGVGRFSLRGRYDPRTKEVWFHKHYLSGGHDVYYRGFREIKGIWGVWFVPEDVRRGGFHIWLCGEGEALSQDASARGDAPIGPLDAPTVTPRRPHGDRPR
jgi:hypothetical protein